MRISQKEAKKRVESVRATAVDLNLYVNSLPDADLTDSAEREFQKLYDKHTSAVAKLDALLMNRGQVTEVSDFFKGIGDAVVRAQKVLDSASQSYIDGTRNQPHALPAVFRIPKVSAELKFAFQEVSEKSVHLLFYSEGTEAAKRHEQRLQFEIVAAPPAALEVPARTGAVAVTEAGMVRRQALASTPLPHLSLVLSPPTRARVLDAVKQCQGLASPAQARALEKALISHWAEVLVVEVSSEGTYVLLTAGGTDEHELTVFYLDTTEPTLERVLHRRPSKRTAADKGLRAALESMAEAVARQQAFLEGLG